MKDRISRWQDAEIAVIAKRWRPAFRLFDRPVYIYDSYISIDALKRNSAQCADNMALLPADPLVAGHPILKLQRLDQAIILEVLSASTALPFLRSSLLSKQKTRQEEDDNQP